MTTRPLATVIADHEKWLKDPTTGAQARFNNDVSETSSGGWLYSKDLSNRTLDKALFPYATFYHCDFTITSLKECDFKGTRMYGSTCKLTNFSNSYLDAFYLSDGTVTGRCTFEDCDFRYSIFDNTICYSDGKGTPIFTNCDFSYASFSGAKLKNAIFKNCNFRHADLRNCDLSGVDLTDSFLKKAIMDETTIIDYPMACPETGSFVAYKNVSGYIVELLVPEDARRSSATSKKCRCDKAQVTAIYSSVDSTDTLNEICGEYYRDFTYRVGEYVEAPDFDTNRWNECAAGIHFYTAKENAINYIG